MSSLSNVLGELNGDKESTGLSGLRLPHSTYIWCEPDEKRWFSLVVSLDVFPKCIGIYFIKFYKHLKFWLNNRGMDFFYSTQWDFYKFHIRRKFGFGV